MTERVGNRLESAAARAVKEVLLVAPFVKEPALRRVLRYIRPEVRVCVITRWHPSEIASGVSDISCRATTLDRPNADFRLSSLLHAKYYRFDEVAFVGSANLTMKGLGWSSPSNLELLIQSSPLVSFEADVAAQSVIATEEMQQLMEHSVSELQATEEIPGVGAESRDVNVNQDPPARVDWFPRSRNPWYLFEIQSGNDFEFAQSTVRDALMDLQRLGIPRCSDEAAFNATVAAVMSTHMIIADLTSFTSQSRRFGEVRDWVSNRIPALDDPSLSTQTLYRWVMHFMPERFEYGRPHHSEMIRSRSQRPKA